MEGLVLCTGLFYALTLDGFRCFFQTRNIPYTAAINMRREMLPPIRAAYHFQLWAEASAKAFMAVKLIPAKMMKEMIRDKKIPCQLTFC